MKTGWKTALTIIGATILGLGIPFGTLYALYKIEDKKQMSIFHNAIEKANARIEELSLNDLTYNEFVLSTPQNHIINIVTESIDDIPELIPNVTIKDMDYQKDGQVAVTLQVVYTYRESSHVVKTATFTKYFTITDSSEAKWVTYHFKVALKQEVQSQQLAYRTFINIDGNNIDDYITYEKVDTYQYSTRGIKVTDNLANSYVNKDKHTLNFYVEIDNGTEKILTGLQELSLNVKDPIVLTAKSVQENFSPNGRWYGKMAITLADYQDYDLISNDAFDAQPLAELELPANLNIFTDIANTIKWSKVDKITLVQSSNTSSLYIQDNILYSRVISQGEGSIYYFIGAMTIADRSQRMAELVLFDDTFVQPYESFVLNTYIMDHFYDEYLFRNVQKINLENTHLNYVGEAAFKNCQKLSDNVRIIANEGGLFMTYFMSEAFAGSNVVHFQGALLNAAFLVYIGVECFSECLSLQSVDVTYTAAMLSIDKNAFFDCPQLTQIAFHQVATSTYLILDLILAFLIVGMILVYLVSLIAAMLLLAHPIYVAPYAFGTSAPVTLDRTITFGGWYSLCWEDYAFSSQFQKTDIYVNDYIHEDPETHSRVSSLCIWPLTPAVLADVTALHIHQVNSDSNIPFDKSYYPSDVQNQIVEAINLIK